LLISKGTNKCIENVATFKYLGMRVTNKNCVHEEIESSLNLGNASYRAVQNLVFLSPI
jgi:hypothetical protein